MYNWSTFHEEISKLKDIFHMNGYPNEISYNHVKTFFSEKLMTTNSCQNMNDEKKYTVIIQFIGHPSIIIKSHYIILYNIILYYIILYIYIYII